MIALDVNNKDVVQFTNKLEKVHKSAFPVAVRSTLNDLAFDVKKVSLIKKYEKTFIVRDKFFIKRYSGVDKATGFNVNVMESKVGIIPGSSIAARNLSKQETGGVVKRRDFIYHDKARVAASRRKKVRKGNYLSSLEHVNGAPSVRRRSRAANFVAASVVGMQTGKPVMWKTRKGNINMLFNVSKVSFSGKGKNRKVNVRSQEIATYEQGRTSALKARQFLLPASLETLKNTKMIYARNAKKGINKYLYR